MLPSGYPTHERSAPGRLWQSPHVWLPQPHPGTLRSSFQYKPIPTRQSRGKPNTASQTCVVPFRASLCFSVAFPIHSLLTSQYYTAALPHSLYPDVPSLMHTCQTHINTRPPPLPLFRRSWAFPGSFWCCLFIYFALPNLECDFRSYILVGFFLAHCHPTPLVKTLRPRTLSRACHNKSRAIPGFVFVSSSDQARCHQLCNSL